MKKIVCLTCYESNSCESSFCKKCATPLPKIPQDPVIIRILVVCLGVVLLVMGLVGIFIPKAAIGVYQLLGYGIFRRWLFGVHLPELGDFVLHLYNSILLLITGAVLLRRHVNRLYLKYGMTVLK